MGVQTRLLLVVCLFKMGDSTKYFMLRPKTKAEFEDAQEKEVGSAS